MRTKQTSKRIRTVRRHRLALALVGAMAMPAAMAQSLPSSGSVVPGSGSATITNSGLTTTINQSTQGVIINWGSFSIGSGYGVTFNQPNAQSVALNRVVGFGYGPSASVISGSLSANGHVFIVNPAGITFNSTGTNQINVGGLVASTIGISDANFNAGVSSRVFNFDGSSASGNVGNSGAITASNGGRVVFLAPNVSNTGTITATDGSVAFGAASTVTLDLSGDGLTQVTLNSLAASTVLTQISNEGTIAADGGQILMRALSDPTGAGGTIRAGGTLQARSMVNNAGNVELVSEGGDVILAGPDPVIILFAPAPSNAVPGVIDVSSTTGAGGSVSISGNNVLMYRNPASGVASSIDASGQTVGGSVSIAATTDLQLDPATIISANGAAGAGGTINLASGRSLAAYGSLSARGGTVGGSITTTSAGDFDIQGLLVDAGSSGAAGTWTLEAPNITVVAGNDVGPVDGVIQLGQDVQDGEINNALGNGTNVTLRAGISPADGGYVHFADGVDILYDGGTVPLSFRVDAQAAITGSNFSITANGAALSMAFNADANNLNNGFGDINFSGATLDSDGGDILFYGQSDAAGGFASSYATGVALFDSTITTAAGNVVIRGASTASDAGSDDAGVVLDGTIVSSEGGHIAIEGTGQDFTGGVHFIDSIAGTQSGTVSIIGSADGTGDGLHFEDSSVVTGSGAISLDGTSTAGDGIEIQRPYNFLVSDTVSLLIPIGSQTGDIAITGSGATGGVLLQDIEVLNSGGNTTITGMASGTDAIGVRLDGSEVTNTTGGVNLFGNAAAGTGVDFVGASGIATTSGAIGVTGIGATAGLALTGGELMTDSGHFDLRGRGTGAASDGLVIGQGVSIATNGGGIELSGEGGSGAGLLLQSGSSVDAGNSLVVLRAGNDGSSDAIRIDGTIASGMAVNLRPGGVDANGGLTERTADEILIGGGTTGFALSGAELAMIDTPQLVVGSNLHAGAIRVLGATTRDGNLTLQNDGGSGGIDLQAALDVGDGVLALSSGGDIVQAASGAITAHSLLARAGGDVLLANASNNVAANTLAGSSGGDFEYQDVDELAIGSVSAAGFDAASNGLSSLGANGIAAGGDVFVRNLAGDMILNAGVSGVNVDLVTANTLQNLAGASIVASGDWRVWANTWVGETRGGLAGDGNLPNLYGCAYLGQCGVTVPSADNHFIYVQQPTAVIAFDNKTREYGLPNPLLTFSVSGAILGDSAGNVATGTGTTTATIGSNVGLYPITGNFTSAAGYRIQFVPGTLAITPATLLFTADQFVRYLGTENPLFTGIVAGFRNGDTVQSVFGGGVVWNSPAGILSPIGFYPINGGTSATNYVFAQAPGNATALQIIPLPQLSSTPIDLIRETVNTYVYDRNFGGAPMCALNASLDDQQLASFGDELSNEWSKVRSRPNLTNCFETERKNSCGDF